MSGRGVITSRTTVSVKSTIDCSSSRPSSSEIVALRLARPSGAAACGAPRRAVGAVRQLAPRADDVEDASAVTGVSSRASGVKHRQQDVEHRFGIAPHDEHRQQVLADDDERDERDDERRRPSRRRGCR